MCIVLISYAAREGGNAHVVLSIHSGLGGGGVAGLQKGKAQFPPFFTTLILDYDDSWLAG